MMVQIFQTSLYHMHTCIKTNTCLVLHTCVFSKHIKLHISESHYSCSYITSFVFIRYFHIKIQRLESSISIEHSIEQMSYNISQMSAGGSRGYLQIFATVKFPSIDILIQWSHMSCGVSGRTTCTMNFVRSQYHHEKLGWFSNYYKTAIFSSCIRSDHSFLKQAPDEIVGFHFGGGQVLYE